MASEMTPFIHTAITNDTSKTLAALKYQNQTRYVQQRYSDELLELAQIATGQNVLDIGCGCGNIASVIAEMVGENGHVVAIDPNVDRIKAAKKMFGHYTNITFVNCKSTEFPLNGEKYYDVVLSNAVLHWIPTSEKIITLQRIKAALKPFGVFVGNISFSRSYNMRLATSLLKPNEQEEIENMYYRENYDKLYNLFAEAGFDICLYKKRYKELSMGTVNNFLDWITATYYGKYDFENAFKSSTVSEDDFEKHENGSVKHISEGATFALRVAEK